MSLRARILALSTGIAALVIVLAAIPLAILMRSSAYSDGDREATFAAQSVADYVSTGRYDTTLLRTYLQRQNARHDVAVSVRLPGGQVVGPRLPEPFGRSRPSAEVNDSLDTYGSLGSVGRPEVHPVDDGRLVEIHVQATAGVAEVFAFVGEGEINERVQTRFIITATVAVILVLIAGFAAEVTTRRLVRPLDRTAQTARRLSRGDLTARAPTEGPREVSDVATELNALADRIDELLRAERETVADLSHRLRTPLTALRLSIEALGDDAQRDELERHATSLERTLTQVIRAARRTDREGIHPHCDAVQIADDRVAFWSALADDQDRTVVLRVPEAARWVRSNPTDLAATLDALIENVLAHTPDGTPFEVAVEDGDAQRAVTAALPAIERGVVVSVIDEGPGIPAGAAVRGRSDRGSTGLGLDIARTHAEGVGGRFEIDRVDGRTVVRLVLPMAPQPAS